MRLYSELFETVGMKIAQLLVSQRDFLEQQRWAEIRDTISACLDAGVVPVINENDTTNTATRMFLKSDCEHVSRMSSVKLGTHISKKVIKLALCQARPLLMQLEKKVHPTFATRNTQTHHSAQGWRAFRRQRQSRRLDCSPVGSWRCLSLHRRGLSLHGQSQRGSGGGTYEGLLFHPRAKGRNTENTEAKGVNERFFFPKGDVSF